MVHRIAHRQFHRLDAPFKMMVVLEVGASVHLHDHACRQGVAREVQRIEVNVVEVQAEVGFAYLSVNLGFGACMNLQQFVVAHEVNDARTFVQVGSHLHIVERPFLVLQIL